MKASAVLLRWYKSFNINYLGYDDRQPDVVKRPWNCIASPTSTAFRFIEIPLRPDVTTIVGGNESGKSHLLSGLRKVIHGDGIPEADGASEFNVTDLCHYASVRDKNAASWPNIGATFSDVNQSELANLVKAAGESLSSGNHSEVTLVLAHDEKREAVMYFGRGENDSVDLNASQLAAVRQVLPKVEFIKSDVPLAGEVPIDNLLANSRDTKGKYVEFDLAQEAARLVSSLSFDPEKKLSNDQFATVKQFQSRVAAALTPQTSDGGRTLVSQLFEDVLGIGNSAIDLLASIKPKDRGFAEGLVATWNQELDRKLNLRRFWQQDDQFALSIDFKGGWFYFEIRDKTGSVYTFRERSSGLRYFLSYYIQAKSIEARSKNNCIILMDEPDSFLSISGQKNLLAVFESLVSPSQGNTHLQLIYTTHSPFLINPNYPHRIRLVRKGDAEEGSQHIPESRLRRYEPVRSALGIDCAQTLFMGEANILLEGASDQFLIMELIRFYAELRKVPPVLDLSATVVMSAESAPGVAKVLDASKWGDERIPATVVLFDSDDEGITQRKRITGKAKLAKLIDDKFVVLIGEAVVTDDSRVVITTEDLVSTLVFQSAVMKYIEQWYPEQFTAKQVEIRERVFAPDFSLKGNAAGAQSIFNDLIFDKPRDFDKMGVMHFVVEWLEEEAAKSPESLEIKAIEKNLHSLLICLRRKVEESRYESQKESARQAIVRTTDDFFKRFKNAAEAFEIELHLERVSREIDSIGDDAAELKKVLNVLFKEVRGLRATGEPLLKLEAWYRWSSLLYAIKKNPLEPEIEIEGNRAEPVHLWKPETTETEAT
ncbi:MAG: AAA family ATPase [Planctomycetaceae bacterium]